MVRFMRLGLELPRVGFGDRRNETQSSRDRHRRRDKVLSFAAISTSQRMRRQAQIVESKAKLFFSFLFLETEDEYRSRILSCLTCFEASSLQPPLSSANCLIKESKNKN
ncbi:unnamed protein product [Brassica rapa]|uniref:Uncharacterized protein n=1 Tax=Brassica campestris TaxID=3711 RepID=A0A3P5ZEP4_BRACM|nr:unnamed protein product [Brassica rapa]VDC71300.1 unnamed protein product [Brassica rapa]